MKIRNLVIIGIIATMIIIAITVVITKNIYSSQSQGSEDYYNSEEEVEMITVKVLNSTGKTIDILYTYQENNEKFMDNGKPIWIDTLYDKPIEADGTREIQLESRFYDDLWDFMIVTEDEETYEMKEILSTNYVYDGAVLEFVIDGDYLDIVENSESATEEDYEDEPTDQADEEQEEAYVEVVEDEEQTEDKEQVEFVEENTEENDEEGYYLEDFDSAYSDGEENENY